MLNLNDIESFLILKDVVFLVVYGLWVVNGIVMVKIKQGGKGKIVVNYMFNVEFS